MRIFYLEEPVAESHALNSIMNYEFEEDLITIGVSSGNSTVYLGVRALSIGSNLDGSFTIRGAVREVYSDDRKIDIPEVHVKVIQQLRENAARVLLFMRGDQDFDKPRDDFKTIKRKKVSYHDVYK